MEAVSLDAFGRQGAWQAEGLRDIGLTAMKGCVETGNLRHIGKQRLERANAGYVVRFVQGG